MKKELVDIMNKQINAEFYSAYMYLSMAAYFEDLNMPGFAHWMRVQFQEEQIHAMKLFDHLVERGERVLLAPIEGPDTEWNSAEEIFEKALAHEKLVTEMINQVADVADDVKDRPVQNLMKWFIDEQVEEEDSTETILRDIQRIGGQGYGLLMLDRELAARVLPVSQNSQE